MNTKKFVLLINPNEFLGSQKSEMMKISEVKKNTKNSLKIKMSKEDEAQGVIQGNAKGRRVLVGLKGRTSPGSIVLSRNYFIRLF